MHWERDSVEIVDGEPREPGRELRQQRQKKFERRIKAF